MVTVLRVTTLKAAGSGVAGLIDYYAGLAEDARREGLGRGPVDYYLDPDEPPGRWWGEGCAAVDLEGDVGAERLRRMLEGRHPGTDGPLGRLFGDKSARGFDATFSAPKSVSVLWALSPDPWVRVEVLAAHDAAVRAALGWVRDHGAVTRRGKDGVDQVDTRGLVAALFRQHTSRSVDPQLHTHALIWSKVQDPSGRWLSLDARWLKYQQRSIGWVYDAALRAELTGRLGVQWDPVTRGHADLPAVPESVREVFSQRSAQVEATMADSLRRWADEHDGLEPDARTIARLQRLAVLDSRPAKMPGQPADSLRSDWSERARGAGFDAGTLTAQALRRSADTAGWSQEAVLVEAVARVTAESATWLQADLAREIATLVPAGAAATAEQLVALVDQLAQEAAGRCVELSPAPVVDVARRRDGRLVTEHVVDRRLTTQAVLEQEQRLLTWAGAAVVTGTAASTLVGTDVLDDAQAQAARAMAGTAPLVLVVGPAGTGKTTALASVVATLRSQDRPMLGLAPSGKAADVLAREASCPTMTVAKLLALESAGSTLSPPGTTVILDEAGMASTDNLDRLVALVVRNRWRLACVGDPFQLPAVGRGGMFAHWCDTLPAVRLEEVRRFLEPWEAEASLGLRAGDRHAVDTYAAHGRLTTTHPALVADRVARQHEQLDAEGATVAVTTTSASTARAINQAIQHRQGHWHHGGSAVLRDGTQAWIGDRVATRHSDKRLGTTSGTFVRNRHTWTVTAVHPDGALVVHEPERGGALLPASYVAEHVELGWAVTGYGNQGATVDHGICVVEATTGRAGLYVGMTRGRRTNVAWTADPTGIADPADTLASIVQRPAYGVTAHATRDRLGGHRQQEVQDDAQRMQQRLEQLQRRQRQALSRR